MPGVAPTVVRFCMSTDVPLPSDGVTAFGVYVTGSGPANVPRFIGLFGSYVSEAVVRVTVPAKDWFRLTFMVSPLTTIPVDGTAMTEGGDIAKSGIAMTDPG